MTNEERDELRRDLEAAGCPVLARRLYPMWASDREATELRSLLRREERLRVMEAGVRAADRLLDASDMTPVGERRYVGSITEDRETFCTAADLLETEAPNGSN